MPANPSETPRRRTAEVRSLGSIQRPSSTTQSGKVAQRIEVSPDGKNVYVVSVNSHAIAIFDRDTVTGALTQKPGVLGCVSDDGSGGACTDGSQLVYVTQAAISPDGKNLYAVAGLTGSSIALTIFDRSTITGEISQKAGTAGCISYTGTGGLCVFQAATDLSRPGRQLWAIGAV